MNGEYLVHLPMNLIEFTENKLKETIDKQMFDVRPVYAYDPILAAV